MPQEKIYVLKKEFPGGYKKGDAVSDRGTGVWYWVRTQTFCPYDPEKETSFFSAFTNPLFKKDDIVHVKKDLLSKPRFRNIGVRTELIIDKVSVSRSTKHGYVYDLKLGNKLIANVSENDIYKPTFYWFINSSGKICKDIALGIDPAFLYRCKSNNVFRDSDSAKEELNKVMNIKL